MLFLSQNVWRRIRTDFDSSLQQEIAEMLNLYNDEERELVQINILSLAKGDRDEICNLVDEANTDYKNILHWAEHPEEYQPNTAE